MQWSDDVQQVLVPLAGDHLKKVVTKQLLSRDDGVVERCSAPVRIQPLSQAGAVMMMQGPVRKSMLQVICVGLLALPVAVTLCAPVLRAQAVATKTNIDDTWQGTLHVQRDLRVVMKITKAPDGKLTALFYSIDQGGQPLPVKTATFGGGVLTLGVEIIDGGYTAKLSPDGTTLTGEWKQGDKTNPLILLRATPETAWTIPEPPKRLPPMAADADPGYEIATIKMSPPDQKGKGFGGPPGQFLTRNTTVNDLMMYAYKVHTKQIASGPTWMDSEKFDIQAKFDTPGQPSDAQSRRMMQKLLVSRFGLKFHEEKREIAALVLTVAKGGPKLEKSTEDEHAQTGFGFPQLGHLVFRNITMPDFASWMQTVLDRPVVDHTQLEGRFEGKLVWNPDETQFAVFGPPPAPSTAPDAPPPLYRAIQEQIGLKLDPQKTAVTVMVVDHVEKPSDN